MMPIYKNTVEVDMSETGTAEPAAAQASIEETEAWLRNSWTSPTKDVAAYGGAIDLVDFEEYLEAFREHLADIATFVAGHQHVPVVMNAADGIRGCFWVERRFTRLEPTPATLW